jgi:uncharacterized membrane protein YkvA (DUF1232 family)
MRRFLTWVWALRRDVLTLFFALKHPDTPWYVKVFSTLLVVYALSPIDLLPDFIPVLGYIDDLVIVPAGVWGLLKIVPAPVLADSSAKSNLWLLRRKGKPLSRLSLAIIIAIALLVGWTVWHWFTT